MKQKMYKKIIFSIVFLLAANFIFYFSSPALAGDVNDLWGGSTAKDYIKTNSGLPAENNQDLRLVVAGIIREILGFLGILAVIIVLYAGFKWMFSGGSEEKISDAKKMLFAGLVGLVIILLSYAIASFVLSQISIATSRA